MSGHYEDEREFLAKLQRTSQELAQLQMPNRIRVVAPDVKPNRPGRYRPGKPKP